MHILITRPEPDASALKAELASEGHTGDLAPLLEISIAPPALDALLHTSALVVTSRNGLRALEAIELPPEILARPLLVVGSGTAAAARRMGFADVTVGPATAKDLVPLIIAAWSEKIAGRTPTSAEPALPVLHLSGDKLSFDLVPPLSAAGVPLERLIVYRSEPANALPEAVVESLAHGAYDAIILMSPLSAETFVDLAQRHGVTTAARGATYLCLSKPIAERMRAWGPTRTEIATRPNLEEMLALIRRVAAQSGAMSPPGSHRDTTT